MLNITNLFSSEGSEDHQLLMLEPVRERRDRVLRSLTVLQAAEDITEAKFGSGEQTEVAPAIHLVPAPEIIEPVVFEAVNPNDSPEVRADQARNVVEMVHRLPTDNIDTTEIDILRAQREAQQIQREGYLREAA